MHQYSEVNGKPKLQPKLQGRKENSVEQSIKFAWIVLHNKKSPKRVVGSELMRLLSVIYTWWCSIITAGQSYSLFARSTVIK